MRARRILNQGGFAPEDVLVLEKALEAAFAELLRREYTGDRDACRQTLATIILANAGAQSRFDSDELAAAAVSSFLSRGTERLA